MSVETDRLIAQRTAEILNEPGDSGTAWANVARRLATAEVALEAAEKLIEQQDARWQEMEHPFDAAEHAALRERAVAAEAQRDTAEREARHVWRTLQDVMDERDALRAALAGVAPPEATEGVCMICGRDYAVWFAPSDLWNHTMRDKDGREETPFVCPTCFTLAAEKAGIDTTAWMVTTEAGGPVRCASQVQVAPPEAET